MDLKLIDTVQHAILVFSSTEKGSLDVLNEEGVPVGFITLQDLHVFVQEGRYNETIGCLLLNQKSEEDESKIPNENNKDYTKLIQSQVFTDVINSFYDGVYITDGNGITVKINKAYERITGFRAQDVVGFHMDDLVKRGLLSNSVSIEVLKEKRPITMMQTVRNERKIIVSGTPIYHQEKIMYVINSVRDITELLLLKHEVEDLQQLKKLRQSTKDLFTSLNSLDSVVTGEDTADVFSLAERIADKNVKVLLQGETGVGKSLVAKYIHEKSKRSSKGFLEFNCGALPANLIEAELFGYESGAFTGASAKGKKGLLELAHEGTLFLDEIGDLPLELQVKLLKVIDDQKFIPVGSLKVKEVDVRIIAATHRNLEEMVTQGTFREDLYYRLNVVPINIPPLRARRKELSILIQYYLDNYNEKHLTKKHLSIEAFDLLCEYHWPGNIRQLMNIIERLVVSTVHGEILSKDLPIEIRKYQNGSLSVESEIIPMKKAVEKLERNLITNTLRKYKTTRKAAEVLQISQSSIVQKMKKWEMSD